MTSLVHNESQVSEVHWKMGNLSYDEWENVGRTLMQIKDSINWWIGDWLNEGEYAFGETYAQAIEITGWDISRLQSTKWVSSRVPITNRFTELSWSHHHFAAKYEPDEQYALLQSAIEDELSTREFKQRLKEYDNDKLLLLGGSMVEQNFMPFTKTHDNLCDLPSHELDHTSPKPQQLCPHCGKQI